MNNILIKYTKRFSLIITLLLLLSILGACSKDEQKKNKKEEVKETLFAVNTFKAVSASLDDYLEFGGDVVASSNVDIVPETTGKLSAIYVSVGATVKKDQVIAEVDPSRPGMTYSVSPVKAPIAGTITSLPVSIGSMVAPSISIGKVSNTNKLEISMSVPERFVSRIKLNQTAYLRFDAYSNESFVAKITKISPVLDTTTRTMAVTLQLINSDTRIRAGMFARIKLITDQKKNIIVIPWTSVVTRQGESFIFIAENASGSKDVEARKQRVSIGLRVDDKVEILSGVNEGDMIIVKGQTLLENGSKLNVISREE